MTTDDALTLIAGLPDVRMTVAPIGDAWYCGINYRGGPMNGVRACRSSPQAAIFGVARQVELQKPEKVWFERYYTDDFADLLG